MNQKEIVQLIKNVGEDDLKKIEYLRPSMCQQYRECGRITLYREILGIEQKTTYPATAYGTAIHNAVDFFGRFYKRNKNIDFIDIVTNRFLKYFDKESKAIKKWRNDSYNHLVTEGKFAIKELKNHIMPIFERGNYDTEVKYIFNIKGVNRPIQCTADIVDYSTDTIYDMKFGRGMFGYADPRGYKLNMSTYAYGYKLETGVYPKVKLIKQLWKAKQKDKVKKWYFTDIALDDLQDSLNFTEDYSDYYQNIIADCEKGIDNKIFLPAVDTNYLCKVCYYQVNNICDIPGLERKENT